MGQKGVRADLVVLEAQYAIDVVRIHFEAMMCNYAPCEVQHCLPAE